MLYSERAVLLILLNTASDDHGHPPTTMSTQRLILHCIVFVCGVGGPLKGLRDKGNRHIRDLKFRRIVFSPH